MRPGAANVGLRDALLLCIDLWMTRAWGGLNFRITQIFTGHGCFGTFLYRIGIAKEASCPFCDMGDDFLEHTMQVCPEWLSERNNLANAIGQDLSLASILRAISFSREAWLAFTNFTERVMRAKKTAERAKETAEFFPGSFDLGYYFVSSPDIYLFLLVIFIYRRLVYDV